MDSLVLTVPDATTAVWPSDQEALIVEPTTTPLNRSGLASAHRGLLNACGTVHVRVVRYHTGALRTGYIAEDLTALKRWLTSLYPDDYAVRRAILPSPGSGTDAVPKVGHILQGSARRRPDWMQPLRPVQGMPAEDECPLASAGLAVSRLHQVIGTASGPMILQVSIKQNSISSKRQQRIQNLQVDEDTLMQIFDFSDETDESAPATTTEPRREANQRRYQELSYLSSQGVADVVLNWQLLATDADTATAQQTADCYGALNTTHYRLEGVEKSPTDITTDITDRTVKNSGLRMHRLPDLSAFWRLLGPIGREGRHTSPTISVSEQALPHFTVVDGSELPEQATHGYRADLPATGHDDSR